MAPLRFASGVLREPFVALRALRKASGKLLLARMVQKEKGKQERVIHIN